MRTQTMHHLCLPLVFGTLLLISCSAQPSQQPQYGGPAVPPPPTVRYGGPAVPPPPTVQPGDSQSPNSGVATGQPGNLPDMASKPKPVEMTFQGCPPEGDGGDQDLNLLKNRVDAGQYVPVQFDAIEQLPWPKGIEMTKRSNWSASDTAEIARSEGIPVAVEGYLANARLEGPESPNCHGADPPFRDFHVWMVNTATSDRSASVVVETTPRVRAHHPAWTAEALQGIAQAGQHVRISGWLMMDQEHPDQVGKTRGTIWEIHPIMQIEVDQGGRWVPLDSGAAPAQSQPGVPVAPTAANGPPRATAVPQGQPGGTTPNGADCPKDHPIKGNIRKDGTRIYHVPGDQSYTQTHPEQCFATTAEAEAAGFHAPGR